jgi:raffinose/stachyose/melibiose transport system permease protein
MGSSQGFIQVPLACLVAMILVRKPHFWRSLRTIYYLPNVISTVALAMVWVAIYNVEGPLNAILGALFGAEKRNWLATPIPLSLLLFSRLSSISGIL